MLSRLFPLGVKVSFENRDYKLGETINLTVELSPKRDMEVREGRVDLVCEERWTEVSTVMVPVSRPSRSAAASGTRGGPVPRAPRIPKQVHQEYRETFVHSTFVFLEDTRLASGKTGSYNARLEIKPEPPPHAREGKVRWRLVTTTDVAGARDIKARRLVKVSQG